LNLIHLYPHTANFQGLRDDISIFCAAPIGGKVTVAAGHEIELQWVTPTMFKTITVTPVLEVLITD